MMYRVTLRIESATGFSFTRGGVTIPATPRKGSHVDLGILFNLKPSASNRAKISSVFRTVNGMGKTIETAILFDADNVSDEVMEAIRTYRERNPDN